MIAFGPFDALSVGVTKVRLFANASGSAFAFQAFVGDLRLAVDQEWKRSVATGQAVQLFTALSEGFAVAIALTLRLSGRFEQGDVDWSAWIRVGRGAVGGWHANALSVFQESFLAEASDDAVAGADRARLRVGAGGGASGTARMENFIFTAFGNRWQHHERSGWDWVDLRALVGQDAFSVRAGT